MTEDEIVKLTDQGIDLLKRAQREDQGDAWYEEVRPFRHGETLPPAEALPLIAALIERSRRMNKGWRIRARAWRDRYQLWLAESLNVAESIAQRWDEASLKVALGVYEAETRRMAVSGPAAFETIAEMVDRTPPGGPARPVAHDAQTGKFIVSEESPVWIDGVRVDPGDAVMLTNMPLYDGLQDHSMWALGEDEELTLETAVFQALGDASVCWENMSGTGVFNDTRAKDVGDALIDAVHDMYDPIIVELLEAIRLTQEYHQDPALPGWSWFEAYTKYSERFGMPAWDRFTTWKPAQPGDAPAEPAPVMEPVGGGSAFIVDSDDAQVWAREWCTIARRLVDRQPTNPTIPAETVLIDEGWMIGWFANAIETGRRHHPAQIEADRAAVAEALRVADLHGSPDPNGAIIGGVKVTVAPEAPLMFGGVKVGTVDALGDDGTVSLTVTDPDMIERLHRSTSNLSIDPGEVSAEVSADHRVQATVLDWDGRPEQIRDLEAKVRRLERWKGEALDLMDEWDKVWDACGRPEVLGELKPRTVARFITEKLAES